MMAHNLQLLRLQDDLEQAAKEIDHLQGVNGNLTRDLSSLNTATSRISIENNALRLERDELREVINMADNGIADINSHWKQKFFMWRETESELLKELSENKNKMYEEKSHYEEKTSKLLVELNKLKKELEERSKHVRTLESALKEKDDELQEVTTKLMDESKNNIQHMFLSRENCILSEKVKVLETKVNSFYDDSMRHNREQSQSFTKYEAERDMNNIAVMEKNSNSELMKLKSDLQQKNLLIADLQEQLNRVSCQSEAQSSKIKHLKNQVDSSNNSIAEAAQNAQKEKDKLSKASSTITDLNEKIGSLKKINSEIKKEMTLKFNLLEEKDEQIQHYKKCYCEFEEKVSQLISEVDNYKHTLTLAENEKSVVKRDLESLLKKHNDMIRKVDELTTDNQALSDEVAACNSKISSLSMKYRDAELGSTNADRERGKCQQKMIDLEVELQDKNFQIDSAVKENAYLKEEVAALLNEVSNGNKCLDDKQQKISALQREAVDLASNHFKEIAVLKEDISDKEMKLLSLKIELNEKLDTEVFDKATQHPTAHIKMAAKATNTIHTEPDKPTSPEILKLKKSVDRLTRECSMQEKKLIYAENELKKQVGTIIQKQCQIDQLNIKVSSLKAQEENSSSVEKDSDKVAALTSRITELSSSLQDREVELERLKCSEAELKEREKAFWELSELVNVLQVELDNKHINIKKEVEFYKQRLMVYEARPPSVNKSTSIQDNIDEAVEVVSIKSANEQHVDLKDLEAVMNNLKSAYQDDLNAMHASFTHKMETMDCKKDESLQWIDLLNK